MLRGRSGSQSQEEKEGEERTGEERIIAPNVRRQAAPSSRRNVLRREEREVERAPRTGSVWGGIGAVHRYGEEIVRVSRLPGGA
jgi:hypothetical protein